jgi:hypothetical protein
MWVLRRIYLTGRRYFRLALTDLDSIQDMPPPSHRYVFIMIGPPFLDILIHVDQRHNPFLVKM